MIRSVAVLGAGTMGAQIAAHFANVGVPTLLLDLTATVARSGLDRARTLKPDPFFTTDTWRHITVGGFDTDLARLAEFDWIVEAVVERLDVKTQLLARVDSCRRAGSIVSSNTSGIPISTLAQGRSHDFRRSFLGTHFFNPPRYLHLVEIIPTTETDGAVVADVARVCDRRLGKGVVIAKDTPNFIANHIGLHAACRILDVFAGGQYTIGEIDAMTGPILGRPKSATFRTIDITGLDVLTAAARNLSSRLEDERARDAFELPPIVSSMIGRGWLGEKSGQGFYRRERAADGSRRLLALDPASMEYRPMDPVRIPVLEAISSIPDPADRLRRLVLDPGRVGQFFRDTLVPTLVYTARVALEIANSIDDVDRAMRWGYGWELGPCETWDAIGVSEVLDSAPAAAAPRGHGLVEPPSLVRDLLESHRNRFRANPLPPAAPDLLILKAAKDCQQIVKQNAGASLIDLGDGVLALEFHSKMNTIGAETIEMLCIGVDEASRHFAALVIGNDTPIFSAGANLLALLTEVQQQRWAEVDRMVRVFQAAMLGLRYSDVPVIVAAAGMTLGGGCEVMLQAGHVQAAAETYAGLVETAVGLIPAGGGTTELLSRAMLQLQSASADPIPLVQQAFETIGFARVSTSAEDARRLGFLKATDAVTINR